MLHVIGVCTGVIVQISALVGDRYLVEVNEEGYLEDKEEEILEGDEGEEVVFYL